MITENHHSKHRRFTLTYGVGQLKGSTGPVYYNYSTAYIGSHTVMYWCITKHILCISADSLLSAGFVARLH